VELILSIMGKFQPINKKNLVQSTIAPDGEAV